MAEIHINGIAPDRSKTKVYLDTRSRSISRVFTADAALSISSGTHNVVTVTFPAVTKWVMVYTGDSRFVPNVRMAIGGSEDNTNYAMSGLNSVYYNYHIRTKQLTFWAPVHASGYPTGNADNQSTTVTVIAALEVEDD